MPRPACASAVNVPSALRRGLGSPALFGIVQGFVGASIFFAVGVVAARALGLTWLVFLAGALFFGMGSYIPRLVSPITGAAEASSTTATSYIFEPTPENMRRWRSWWRFANLEQALSFGLVTVVTIGLMSLLAYATLFGQPDLPNDVSFLRLEAQHLRASVGSWLAAARNSPITWARRCGPPSPRFCR